MYRFTIQLRSLTRCSPMTTLPRSGSSPSSNLLRGAITFRSYAVEASPDLDESELKIFNLIRDKLSPTKLDVKDVSGGCGSMYAIEVVSEQFAGLTTIKQQRIVNQVLGDEIKKWHGMRLKTKAPGPEDD